MLSLFAKATWIRKIRKISPGAYIFQGPFSEGLMFGGADLGREICVSKSITLAL